MEEKNIVYKLMDVNSSHRLYLVITNIKMDGGFFGFWVVINHFKNIALKKILFGILVYKINLFEFRLNLCN
jgi:hypothetical protein